MADIGNNAVSLVGDFFVLPGTSQILKGEYIPGLLHAGVGLASKAFFTSPIGAVLWFATAANSYSRTVRTKNLFEESDQEQAEEGLPVLQAAVAAVKAGTATPEQVSIVDSYKNALAGT